MSVKRPHGRALANKSGHLFQTFSRHSEGLATQDYWNIGQPNNLWGNQNCTVINQNAEGRWHDLSCTNQLTFVCYEDKLILIKENRTLAEALRYCRQNHVDLVSVHSEEMQRRVMNVVKRASTAAVWLGLHNYCVMNVALAEWRDRVPSELGSRERNDTGKLQPREEKRSSLVWRRSALDQPS